MGWQDEGTGVDLSVSRREAANKLAAQGAALRGDVSQVNQFLSNPFSGVSNADLTPEALANEKYHIEHPTGMALNFFKDMVIPGAIVFGGGYLAGTGLGAYAGAGTEIGATASGAAMTSEEAFLSGTYTAPSLMPAAVPETAAGLSAQGMTEVTPGVWERVTGLGVNANAGILDTFAKYGAPFIRPLTDIFRADKAEAKQSAQANVAPHLPFFSSPTSTPAQRAVTQDFTQFGVYAIIGVALFVVVLLLRRK